MGDSGARIDAAESLCDRQTHCRFALKRVGRRTESLERQRRALYQSEAIAPGFRFSEEFRGLKARPIPMTSLQDVFHGGADFLGLRYRLPQAITCWALQAIVQRSPQPPKGNSGCHFDAGRVAKMSIPVWRFSPDQTTYSTLLVLEASLKIPMM